MKMAGSCACRVTNRKATTGIGLVVLTIFLIGVLWVLLGMLKNYGGSLDDSLGVVGTAYQNIMPGYACNDYDELKDTQGLLELLYKANGGECGSHMVKYMQTTYLPPASATEDAQIECGTKTEKDICGPGKAVRLGEKMYSTNYQALVYKDTAYCTADPGCGHGKESIHNPWIYLCAPSDKIPTYYEMTAGNNPGPPLDESATKGYRFLNSLTIKKVAYPGSWKLRVGTSGVDVVICLSECTDDKSCEKAMGGG